MGIETLGVVVELLMGTARNALAILHDVDCARIANRGKAVGDDDGGSALHESVESSLNLVLGFAIQRGGGLV